MRRSLARVRRHVTAVSVAVPPAGAGGAAVGGGGLAHGAAARRPAGGQRQQRGVHAGVPHGTLPEGRQEALRQSRQKVERRRTHRVWRRRLNVEVLTAKLLCCRDPEFVFYDQLKQTMNAYRFVLFLFFFF